MNRILPACTCVLLLALLGCAPVKSRVSYVEPAPGEEILNALPTIRVGFDRPMDPGTVNQDTFLVQGSESGAHSGDIVLDPRNTEVTFTPHDPFAAGELITVILKDDIRSQSGKFLKEYRWEFRLLPPPEVELPAFELVSLDPGIESTIAPRLTSITATFSDPYNPFAAAPSSVVVEGERSGAREIAFENLFTGGDALRMTVGRPFLAGESVSVAITPTLTSAAGAPAAAALVRFTVKNAGSLWPEAAHAQGAGLAPGGGLLFRDADADGVDEWALVHPDGLVEAQDASAGDPGPVVSWTLPQGTIDAAAGDFDGDGRADLVCLATDGATLYLFRGAQSISLLLLDPQVITFPGASAVAVAGGHFDEDGVRDLFIRENGGARIAWGGASTPLLTSTELPGIEASAPAAAGDLDGDDLVDIACPLPSSAGAALSAGGAERDRA
ncbi:MAG: Ig-like domain-containing protein, partial [Planctomycetota bacterium]